MTACATCGGSGYAREVFGTIPSQPCTDCRGTGQKVMPAPPARKHAAIRLGRPALKSDSTLSPNDTAMMLKVVLYVGVAAVGWFLYRYSGGEQPSERDLLNVNASPSEATSGDFSFWEPES